MPAIVVAVNVLLFHGALSQFTGVSAGIAHYVWIVAGATSITLVPFAVLLSFVLRIGRDTDPVDRRVHPPDHGRCEG
jgi:hypothetical protein